MRFIKNIFRKSEQPAHSYEDFWNWLSKHEKTFFKVVQKKGNIERDFFDKLSLKLNALKDGYFFVTGMLDENTVELIITADGTIKNIVFVEELINAAPQIGGWKFTALKPALDISDVLIEMSGYKFCQHNMGFYWTDHPKYPDEIDITIVHDQLDSTNKNEIVNGTYLFLDNYLGELDFATTIDNLSVVAKKEAKQEPISIDKLKGFLTWRQKEFIEKYEDIGHNTANNNYSILKAQLENGNVLIALVNTELLEWDKKASHPWILTVAINYNGTAHQGMPDKSTCKLLNEIENAITTDLKDVEGYLLIGRQTADNVRQIYVACKDFRKPSKCLYKLQTAYANQVQINYEIYKDKYWQSFSRFRSN